MPQERCRWCVTALPVYGSAVKGCNISTGKGFTQQLLAQVKYSWEIWVRLAFALRKTVKQLIVSWSIPAPLWRMQRQRAFR